MVKYHEVTGMPVLSRSEGKAIGITHQLAVDLTEVKVVALVIEAETTGSLALPIKNIYSFGRDCVMAHSENDMLLIGALAKREDNIEFCEKIVGISIVTENESHVGEVGSFCFEEGSGMITHFITSEGLFSDWIHGKGLLAKEGVLSFSRNALVVTEASAELARIMKTRPGLKHKATSITQRVESRAKEAKKKVEIALKSKKSVSS